MVGRLEKNYTSSVLFFFLLPFWFRYQFPPRSRIWASHLLCSTYSSYLRKPTETGRCPQFVVSTLRSYAEDLIQFNRFQQEGTFTNKERRHSIQHFRESRPASRRRPQQEAERDECSINVRHHRPNQAMCHYLFW